MRQSAYFGCLSHTLANRPPSPDGAALNVTAETTFGAEFDALWAAAQAAYPIACGVERSKEWLAFKHGAELVLAARNDAAELMGVVAVSPRTGGITTLLSRTRAVLPWVVSATVHWLMDARERTPSANLPTSLSAVDVPHTRAALLATGFSPVAFRFALVADSLNDAAVPIDALRPEAWYLTTGD
jgi:hypothetical protein